MFIIRKIAASLSRPATWLASGLYAWVAKKLSAAKAPGHSGINTTTNNGQVTTHQTIVQVENLKASVVYVVMSQGPVPGESSIPPPWVAALMAPGADRQELTLASPHMLPTPEARIATGSQ